MKVSPCGDDLLDPCASAHSFFILYSFFFIISYFSGGANNSPNSKHPFPAAALLQGYYSYAAFSPEDSVLSAGSGIICLTV